jgi:hypothetical protein
MILPLILFVVLIIISPTQMIGTISQGISGGYKDEPVAESSAELADTTKSTAAQMQKESRANRQTNLDATKDPSQRFTAFKRAIDDANDMSDFEDALRLAQLFYTETASIQKPTREKADAALTLALSMQNNLNVNSSTPATNPEIEKLLNEAGSILRERLQIKFNEQDAQTLTQVLDAQTIGADKQTTLTIRQEMVNLLTNSSEKPNYTLMYARENLARALYGAEQIEAAENEINTATAELKNSSAATDDYFYSNLVQDKAWLLIAQHKFDEANQLITPFFNTPDDVSYGDLTNQREALQIALMIAYQKGDWQQIKEHATTIRETKIKNKNGNWFSNLLMNRLAQSSHIDPRVTLILIESERKLGNNAAAQDLVNQLVKSYNSTSRTNNTASNSSQLNCKMTVYDTAWKHEIEQMLSDIEKRELKCSTPKLGE